MTKMTKIEDFGARRTVTAKERYAEYQEQCRGLPAKRQAKFWRELLAADPEVAKLVGYHAKKARRGSA